MKSNPDYFHHIVLIILGNKISNMLSDYGLVIRDYKEQLCKCCGQLKIKIQISIKICLDKILFEETRK